jgi:DNA-directed RNA polymerase beta' subunit
MNIHAPQSYEAKAELIELSATKHNLISAQGSKANICIVQDALVGAYLMTKDDKKLTKSQFFDLAMKLYKPTDKGDDYGGLYSPERIKEISKILKKYGKKSSPYTGRGLLSLLLPNDFIYERKTSIDTLKIERGVIYEGTFEATSLGRSHNSIIQILNKEYGKDIAVDFVNNIQFAANNWLQYYGFSIGLQDCMITSLENTSKIEDAIEKCYIEAKGVEKTTKNDGIKEVRISAALNKAKDIGMRIAKNGMTKNNNLLSTVGAGSKGDFFNIAQITGILGQQNLKIGRVPKQLNNCSRTLPHYQFGDLSIKEEFESRGFIKNSFIHGLNPQEFFFHAMSGREGICDKLVSLTVSCLFGCFVTNQDKQCKTTPTTMKVVVYNLLVTIKKWQDSL